MRASLPILLCLTSACVDVQHVLALSPDGAVAYRLRLTAAGPSLVDKTVLSQVPHPESGVVRAWQDRIDGQLVWVIQGQFPDSATFTDWTHAAWARATQQWPEAPDSIRPPQLDHHPRRQDWTMDWAASSAVGKTELVLTGVEADPPAPHVDDAGTQHWSFSAPTPPRVRATLRPPGRFALGRFFAEGGPSLGFALAGLGLLAWVYRRMRRQQWRRQKAHGA
ncbi:MAG: hypothetical protein AB8H79_11020 [Myxococcota bacterium]